MDLGSCKKWSKESADPSEKALDRSTEAQLIDNENRGHGGFGIIFNPLIKYKIRDGYTAYKIQALTSKVAATMTTVYPKAHKQRQKKK